MYADGAKGLVPGGGQQLHASDPAFLPLAPVNVQMDMPNSGMSWPPRIMFASTDAKPGEDFNARVLLQQRHVWFSVDISGPQRQMHAAL